MIFFSQNLVCGKNVLIDMSIHTAYVKAIRAAQHYIYIENQYFIGSSYNWSQNKDIGKQLLSKHMLLVLALKNFTYYYVAEFGEHKLTGHISFCAMLIYGEFIFYHLNCVASKLYIVWLKKVHFPSMTIYVCTGCYYFLCSFSFGKTTTGSFNSI